MFNALLQGFFLGASLIIAIGSQNAFVLRQGLKREWVFLVCLICALSDALLITVGVSGMGTLVAQSEVLLLIARLGGALFLTVYGSLALRAALGTQRLKAERDAGTLSASTVIGTTLALTYLNPHVYLDTVVLLGSISAQLDSSLRVYFAFGAVLASFGWFFALGFGARVLAPIFERPTAWKILDLCIALVMYSIALSLILPVLLPLFAS